MHDIYQFHYKLHLCKKQNDVITFKNSKLTMIFQSESNSLSVVEGVAGHCLVNYMPDSMLCLTSFLVLHIALHVVWFVYINT